jgi:hypothetical protein
MGISIVDILKKHLALLGGIFIVVATVATVNYVHATPVIGFEPGRIIDDAVFTNKSSMSAGDIQTFINAKGVNCTDGEAPCLKNYSEGGRSAAQIIYDTAQQYNINPQALIVTLQKEVGLVTANQPGAWRYRTAMGYGCPDTAACDSQYYGFTNQMRWAATMYHAIMTDNPNWYTPYNLGNNNIKWNPESSCGTSVVYIENRATKALYNYTPYRPNQAALDAGYGLGDSCSSYGNRNFFLYFRDWFGATTDNRLFFRVIRGVDKPEVYLQTSAGKYYVPSYTLLAEWGMYPEDVEGVPQSYSDSVPTKGGLSNSLTDGVGNLFVVEGGNTHQVMTSTHTAVWNVDTGSMVESLGLAYMMNRKEPLGRFVSQVGGDGSIWLVDGAKRHLVDPSKLYLWGYYPGITNVVSTNLFSRYVVADAATPFASHDGGTTVWGVDASVRHPFKDNVTRDTYIGSTAVTNVSLPALSLLNGGTPLTRFTYDTTYGHWYMIDAGKKYYILRSELASLWGRPQNEGLTALSSGFLSSMAGGGNLTLTAQPSDSNTYWLVAKQKHYISSSDINIALTGSSVAPPVYSAALISSLPQGDAATTAVRGSSSPYNYSYVLDGGKRRYPQSSVAQSAWISNVLTVPNELMSFIPEGSFIGTVVKNSSENLYFIDANKKYPINTLYSSSWGTSQTTPAVNDSTLTRMVTGSTLTDAFSVNGVSYLMSAGSRMKIGKYKDAYPGSMTNTVALSSPGDMRDGGDVSYLVRSSNPSQQSVWLINKGTKLNLPSFEQRVALGYLSNSLPITTLASETLSSIPDSAAVYSNLIQTGSSGIKFVNFGYALGFPDSPTLQAYTSSSDGILSVSESIYGTFSVRGSASRLVYDDFGRYYWIENGQKRYINSWAAYSRDGYPSINAIYLQGITMNLLPNGATIQ